MGSFSGGVGSGVPADWVALVVGPSAAQAWGAPSVPRVAVVGAGVCEVVDVDRVGAVVAGVERGRPRWVWWEAAGVAEVLARSGVCPGRVWDVAQAHRLIHGGWEAGPGVAWAVAHGLSLEGVEAPAGDDLLGLVGGGADAVDVVSGAGYLLPAAAGGTWAVDDARLVKLAGAVLECARSQAQLAGGLGPRLVSTVYSESAAAVVCVELERVGLPVDRGALLSVIEPLSGDTAALDASVLDLVPDAGRVDLRNPLQVRGLLAGVGIDVPDTRKWTLEAFRQVHPVVPALLRWRADERIRTTYGMRWLAEHVGEDDRLRGRWHPCDGGAGRMTAEAGLHSIPAVLRPGVAAREGWVLVRADLGQVEPRVLAAVSGDRAMAAATAADDLYAGVARQLGVDRSHAKVAMLAAMYGQRTGTAAQALRGLERAFPRAMSVLDWAQRVGVAGGEFRTFGGRLIPTGRLSPGGDQARVSGRGRFARNAIIQGAAAELFKAWVATVRAVLPSLGGEIVMCLHDELLVHVPQECAGDAVALVNQALVDAARRWTGGAPVRFVADTQVVRRWSEAKG